MTHLHSRNHARCMLLCAATVCGVAACGDATTTSDDTSDVFTQSRADVGSDDTQATLDTDAPTLDVGADLSGNPDTTSNPQDTDSPDTSPQDAATPDADADRPDTAPQDAATSDTAQPDTSPQDAATPDADAEQPDTAPQDTHDEDACDGPCVECTHDDQCGADTECLRFTCDMGVCVTVHAARGTPLVEQQAGDCRVEQCDGEGGTETVEDDTDSPDDGNDCTAESCEAGAPVFSDEPLGTSCGASGTCDGDGRCVGCNSPADCPGSDSVCRIRTCIDNMCGVRDTPFGEPLGEQITGDCQRVVCDGAGGTTTMADDTDLPDDDGNACTEPICSSGAPGFSNSAANTACDSNGGAVCDGAGACVQCTTASQCPDTDTECQVRSCEEGTCGVIDVDHGTALSVQVVGDCQEVQCDGAGGTQAVPDDRDVNVDGTSCTLDQCNTGTPSNPPVSAGTQCNDNGGSQCDGEGRCVNSPPTQPIVSLVPDEPLSSSTLEVHIDTPSTDPDGDTVFYTYAWFVNGSLLAHETTSSLAPSNFARDNTVEASVTPSDGMNDGLSGSTGAVMIGNAPPSPPEALLTPMAPSTIDTLVCELATRSTDPDGDSVLYRVRWELNERPYTGSTSTTHLNGDSISPSRTQALQQWTCIITAFDEDASSSSRSNTVTIN